MKNTRTILLLICHIACCQIALSQKVQATDSILKTLQIPLFSIITENKQEPQGYPVYPPEGCVGIGLGGNEYVKGSLVITVKDSVLYNSGDYKKDLSGIRIKQRGNTSALYNKKPYKIKLSKKADLLFRDDAKYKDKDWILLRSGHSLNTHIGFKVSEIVGQRWTPAHTFVNLMINNDYKGIYILSEAIEIEKGRLNLSETGFVLEDDAYWWNEDFSFKGEILPQHMGYTFKSPDIEDIPQHTLTDIQEYIKDVETALQTGNNIPDYIDMNSFAAWLLAHDILGTEDAAGSNRYLCKHDIQESSNTLLEMGPVWDFDDIFKRKDNWSQQHNGNYRFYYKYLLDNQDFTQEYANKWNEIEQSLFDKISDIMYTIKDSIGKDINTSRALDDKRWTRSNPTPSLEDEINNTEEWLSERIAWITENIHTTNNIEENIAPVSKADVYLLDSRLILKGATPDDYKFLPKGIYIANGRKIYVGCEQ